MKKSFFTFLALMLVTLMINAQALYFVGGYVTNLNGGAISNHIVYVWTDSTSSFSYYNSVLTNDNGYYGLSITNLPPSGTLVNFHVATYDCNNAIHTENITNANPQNTVNFSICNSDTTNINSCQAGFYTYQDSLNAGSNIYHFENTSTSTYTGYTIKYSWSYGDGTSSADVNPSHQYATAGTYNVCLTMKVDSADVVICENSSCSTIQIGGTNNSCQAGFTFYTDSIALYTYHFENTSTTTYTGYTINYSWNFGDGATSADINPTHQFASSGTYNVCLTMKVDSADVVICENSSCSTVQLGSADDTTILQGFVYADNEVAHSGYVQLYYANDSTMAYNLFATIALDSNGYYSYYFAPTSNTFIIKASLNTTSPQFANYFPTYFVSTLNWYNAANIAPSTNSESYNIYLKAVPTNPSGDGSIGGNVSNNGKSIAVSGAEVILMDANNNPIEMKLTDANGNYTFSNLATGNYKIAIEIVGKTSSIISVTISTGNPHINGANFVVNGANITASVEESVWFANHISDVYPNPSNSNASIDFSLLKANKIAIRAYNNLGQLVLTNESEYSIGSHKVMLNTNQLSEGIYTIQIISDNSTRIIKKFVKTK